MLDQPCISRAPPDKTMNFDENHAVPIIIALGVFNQMAPMGYVVQSAKPGCYSSFSSTNTADGKDPGHVENALSVRLAKCTKRSW
jgi:hypothetical protein